MRKYLLAIGLLLLSQTAQAQDYWLYIRTKDRPGLTLDDDPGRSKRGDIVDVLPCNDQFVPSEWEKKEYLIIRVHGNPALDLRTLKEPYYDGLLPNGSPKIKAYRRKKLDLSWLSKEQEKPGILDVTVEAQTIFGNVSEKTDIDFANYEGKVWIYANIVRPLQIASNFLVRPAYAETISTINKTGETYNTLTIWEDTVDGNLVGETRQETADCYDDDGVLTDSFLIDGSTTDATYYMKVTSPVGERHSGAIASGFKLKSNGGYTIWNKDSYSVFSYLIVDQFGQGVVIESDYRYFTLHHSFIYSSVASGSSGVYTSGGLSAWNNVVYDVGNAYEAAFYVDGGTSYLYNNTIHGVYRGYYAVGGSVYAYNNLALEIISGGTGFIGDFAGGGYNCSVDDTADNDADIATGAIVNVTATDQVTDLASDDFTVKDTDADIYNAGTDNPGSGLYSDDLKYFTRTSTWDIGAFEYDDGGAPPAGTIRHGSISTGIATGIGGGMR